MAKPEKLETVEEIKEKINESQIIILADYRGLSVNEVSELRKQLKGSNTQFKVYKNSLFSRAIKEQDYYDDVASFMVGPTACAFNSSDPVGPAKILVDFAKQHDKLSIKGGILDSNIIDIDKINYLTKLPSREVLLSKMLGALNSPISGLVTSLHGIPTKLVHALEAIRKQKEN